MSRHLDIFSEVEAIDWNTISKVISLSPLVPQSPWHVWSVANWWMTLHQGLWQAYTIMLYTLYTGVTTIRDFLLLVFCSICWFIHPPIRYTSHTTHCSLHTTHYTAATLLTAHYTHYTLHSTLTTLTLHSVCDCVTLIPTLPARSLAMRQWRTTTRMPLQRSTLRVRLGPPPLHVAHCEDIYWMCKWAHFYFFSQSNVNDIYICVCVSKKKSDVSVPLLVLHALDDPIIPPEAVPLDASNTNPNIIFAVTRYGGRTSTSSSSSSSTSSS